MVHGRGRARHADRRPGRIRLRDGDAGDAHPPAAQHPQRREDGGGRGARHHRRRDHQDRSHRVPGRAQRRDEAEAFSEAAAHGGRSLRDRRRARRAASGAGHGRRHDARVPDVDVRAEGAGRAHRLRVFAHAEPDALRAGGEPGGARGRRLGPGLQRGRRGVDGGAGDVRRRRARRRGRRSLRRVVPAVREGVPAPRPQLRPTRTPATPAPSRRAIGPRTRLVLARDADQSAAAHRRHPRRRARSARRAAFSCASTTRS